MSMSIRKAPVHRRRAGSGPPVSRKPQAKADFVLVAYRCPGCGRRHVLKADPEKWKHRPLRCKCGRDILVTGFRAARGKCKKCGTSFYNMIIVNDLKNLSCRNCRSEIDLFVGRDGKYTA